MSEWVFESLGSKRGNHKGYDSNELWKKSKDIPMQIVILPKKNRVSVFDYNKAPYKQRNREEKFINRIKPHRRIATRYDKFAKTLAAFLHIVAVYIAVS